MRELNIVCYGDSNTYGYTPFGHRYDNRYPVIIKKILGEDTNVYEEGVVGRTSIYSDIRGGRTGINNLDDTIGKYDDIDYLVFMLGTNDIKSCNARSEEAYEYGLTRILDKIKEYKAIKNIILVSPILLDENIEALDSDFDYESYKLSLKSADIYKRLAKKYNALYFDAKSVAYPGLDGEHFTEDGHKGLAASIAKIIRKREDKAI